MSQVIAKLLEDHRRMAVLLEVFERETNLSTEDNNLNFLLIDTMLDYILNFPQKCHHPIENSILKSLVRRDPEKGEIATIIVNEHEKLTNLIIQLADKIARVKLEDPLFREDLVNTVREYRELLLQHMQKEETIFFPAAEEALFQADWDIIETRMRDKGDPVFGREADRQYRALHKVIIEWGGK
ncbi:hemerythrin domain-containing protein [Sneathiella litorea]|nr:hemerythrin domain-containing protein [Sneathiella litorea]